MGVSVRSKGKEKETLINSVLPKHLIGRLAAVNVAADAVDVRKNQIGGILCELVEILHDSPNPEMSSFIIRETPMIHLLLWDFVNFVLAGDCIR